MSDNKEITIYDIAEALQLSPATVSRALKNHPAISKSTKTRILELAKKMGYRSNTFASNLRSNKTNTIGVIAHRLNSNFVASVLSSMEKVANLEGYNLIISQSLESFQKEIANAETMYNSRVDGLLVSLSNETDNMHHFDKFIQKGIPLIFFDRVYLNNNSLSVIIDNYRNGYDVTKHLIEQGCKRIMHITGDLKRNVYNDRYRGYRAALAEAGLSFSDELLMECPMNETSGTEAAQKLLKFKKRPDGIFSAGDVTAAFCIKELISAGLKVPQDIAVAGFNNDPVGLLSIPTLTTVNYPSETLGEVAMKHMIAHLKGEQDIKTTNTVILRSELIVRESSLRT